MSDNLQKILDEIAGGISTELGKGHVADYIPALAAVDPNKFGMAVTTVDGEQLKAGDADEPFSIQSISKIFTLTIALELVGSDLWNRVGREPSGTPFNSLVQLEYERGIPRNPLINAGALVVTDAIVSRGQGPAIAAIVDFIRARTGDTDIAVDGDVARSEKKWGHRNSALANLIKSFGNLEAEVPDVLDAYFNQCAIAMNCTQLSRAVLYLAGGGADPHSGEKVVSTERAKRINGIMLTCGHYDASGEFAFRVGLPGKSGVGGGIVAVVPGRMGIAVWSPALNAQGSSFAGTEALAQFAGATGCSVF